MERSKYDLVVCLLGFKGASTRVNMIIYKKGDNSLAGKSNFAIVYILESITKVKIVEIL